ncbi:DUF7344 domain-containing protein [Natronomonas marina]|jgi:DNA-binding transcriptional ArsR family regulator|uniref:DUF7344 domain-containing protein n=1 Tax=Natronomonas marina TaxID=2961939 RepID=UPI0020C9B698|nr:transcriptional regulator [Natronomonas marina]
MIGDASERTESKREDERREPSVDADEFYRALSREPRRRVLYYLQENDTASVRELCDVLAGWEAVGRSRSVGTETRDRIRHTLYHNDLPKLDHAGLVAYDPDQRRVALSPLPSELSSILRRAREYDARSDPA